MTQFFTIATTNYLPYAVSLLDSVKQYHPEFELSVCLTDYLDQDTIAKNPLMSKYPMVQLHEIAAEEFDLITKIYSPMELANSAKILFAEYFLNKKEVEQVIFCDSDILFFNRLPESVIQNHDLIYTPHFTSAPDLDMKRQELEVLNAGMFNGGFFKLKKSEEATKFIKWFRPRCVPSCISDRCNGYYYDQLWINFVPLYFKDAHIERDQGMNMAYWNLHERVISEKDNQFIVNEATPLSFFHFSGWDYNDPSVISKWSLFNPGTRPDIAPLLARYHEALQKNEYEAYIKLPNYYTARNDSQKKSFFKKLKQKLFKKKH